MTTASSNTIAAGDDISESPAAGTGVLSGTAVSLVISTGATASVLYSFPAAPLNFNSWYAGTLIQGSDKNLYGLTQIGGTNNSGTLFKLSLGGSESTVYSFFAPVTSGQTLPEGLIQGGDGNFYETTSGGAMQSTGGGGAGTLGKITPAGKETTLYNFCGCLDSRGYYEGADPTGLIEGGDGNFYGTTAASGSDSSGTLIMIPPSGIGSVLHTFGSVAGDGQTPVGSLISANSLGQNQGTFLYGVTDRGGANNTGTVFVFEPSIGHETLLYSFGPSSGTDGQVPVAGLVQATNGNFYGMTYYGGTHNTGTVYEIAAGIEKVLYSFGPPVTTHNPTPVGSLIQATDGNLYGITQYGGLYDGGMVFKIAPSGGAVTVVHSYTGGTTDAAYPQSLIQASDGNLYGTGLFGGTNNTGAVFKIPL